MKKTIGIIGFGNMGRAIAERLKNDYPVIVFDKVSDKIKNLEQINPVADIATLCLAAQIVILAIKPQDFDQALEELKGKINNSLIITIAAGIPISLVEKTLGVVSVVRAMPNMPAKIGKGVSCLAKGRYASIEELDFAQNIFDYVGQTIIVDEGLINAATAVSGSGPGFLYFLLKAQGIDINNFDAIKKFSLEEFIPQLTKAAQEVGFNIGQAEFLAVNTAEGSLSLLKGADTSVDELLSQITSKGGTTEAGLAVLAKNGKLEEAVKAAKNRAEELSRR